jgi:hypothetical protein
MRYAPSPPEYGRDRAGISNASKLVFVQIRSLLPRGTTERLYLGGRVEAQRQHNEEEDTCTAEGTVIEAAQRHQHHQCGASAAQ